MTDLIAVLVECCDEVVRDHLRGPTFNLVTLDHVNQLSVFKQSNGR
jgi:hypothetical protein